MRAVRELTLLALLSLPLFAAVPACAGNQLEEQIRLTIEGIKERQEWELINSKKFGLIHSVDPSMRISTRYGAPTPDDLDELLALVWKKPAFFLAHPKAIAAFERECTWRGVPPEVPPSRPIYFPTMSTLKESGT